jgi:hypothetical protein
MYPFFFLRDLRSTGFGVKLLTVLEHLLHVFDEAWQSSPHMEQEPRSRSSARHFGQSLCLLLGVKMR